MRLVHIKIPWTWILAKCLHPFEAWNSLHRWPRQAVLQIQQKLGAKPEKTEGVRNFNTEVTSSTRWRWSHVHWVLGPQIGSHWPPWDLVVPGSHPGWMSTMLRVQKNQRSQLLLSCTQKRHFTQCRSSIRSQFVPLSHACHGCWWFQSWDETLHDQPCELHGPSHRIQPEEKMGIWFS